MLSLLATVSFGVSADTITPEKAKEKLLYSPPTAMSKSIPAHYQNIERLTKPMFSSDRLVRYSSGYENYLALKNKADLRNPYAAYNVGLYQIINREKFGFNYSDSLIYLKLAVDGGIHDAMYSLAIMYLNNSDDVAKAINGPELIKGASYQKMIAEDKKQFRALGQQYILHLALNGHEKAYMTACNFFTKGEYFEKDVTSAALCYHNAIKVFDSSIAKGLLAKIYFDVPQFDSKEFEQLGIDLSKQAASQGSIYATVNLGKQLINPKHIGREHVGIGVQLLQGAAAHGDERAIAILKEYLGEDGVLRVKK